jgi:hypothetical protein
LYSTGNLRKARLNLYQLDGAKQLNREKLAATYQKNMDRHAKEEKEKKVMVEYNIGEKIKKRNEVYEEGQSRVRANEASAASHFNKSNKAMTAY